jgi:DNA polymerase-3 subunit alpha
MDKSQRRQREKSSDQINFLDRFEDHIGGSLSGSNDFTLPDIIEWDHKELLSNEKDTIGFYITGHPLSRFADILCLHVNTDSSTLSGKSDRETVILAGIVSQIREVMTKRKDTMAYLTLEDMKGSVTIIIFPDVYRNTYDLLHSEEPLLIKGTLDIAEDNIKIIASEITLLASSVVKSHHTIYFTVDPKKSSVEDIKLLGQRLKQYPGKHDGYLRIVEEKFETLIYLGGDMKLDISLPLKKEADRLLGMGASQFI